MRGEEVMKIMRANLETFWQNTKYLREIRGLSQQYMADMAGINRDKYSNYERGILVKLPMDIAEAVAKALDTTVEDLLQRKGLGEPLIDPKVQSFWKAVRAKRESMGISQAEMANRLNMSSNNYSAKECGKAAKLPPALKEQVAEALGCTVDELTKNQEEQTVEEKQVDSMIVSSNSKYNIDHLPESIQKFIADKENKDIVIELLITHLMKQKGML
jgi:transcriptional regulator with XRE-family HTH domain